VSTDLLSRGADLVEHADVCVIGSGGGGAVAAAELARGGRSVVVLEQGHHWTRSDFTQREDEMLPRLFEEAGMRQTSDGSVTVLQGRCVGGSTVHNLCYAFRTPAPIVRLWREAHGLDSLTDASLAPSFARVEKQLKVKPIREEEVNLWNRRIREGAQRLGYSGFVTQHNREGCIQAGYCLLGCSYDAKQSMLITYVPAAEQAGARVYAHARAERIEAEHGRVRRVLGHVVDDRGEVHASLEVTARAVVLAAGAVGSPDLLRRSGLGGQAVGRHLHLHPSVICSGVFEDELHAYRGIPQSYYVDEFIDLERDPHAGYVLMPIAGFPGLTAANLPDFGRDHSRLMRSFSRMGGLLVLLHDRSEGRVSPGSSLARPELTYQLDPEDRRQLAEGLVHCAEVLFAAGAKQVIVPYFEDPMLLAPGDDLAAIERRGVEQGHLPIASTHPQSTCRMGTDPASSVVDAWGRCHDVEGLYVADMSVFPTSLGAPPQITTAALADRTAHHILEHWSES
jgi:choline dehydrogenase-like flavoprotein